VLLLEVEGSGVGVSLVVVTPKVVVLTLEGSAEVFTVVTKAGLELGVALVAGAGRKTQVLDEFTVTLVGQYDSKRYFACSRTTSGSKCFKARVYIQLLSVICLEW
jgi:hypothetical protein